MPLIKGVITVLAAILLLILALLPVLLLVLLKLLAPKQYKRTVMRALSSFAAFWLACNRRCYCWIHDPAWLQEPAAPISRDKSYLVLANHQSWSDIPVLLFLMLGKVPFFRFLMKRPLIWLPVIGWGAWALDFPLLYRFSKEHLQRHPEDRLKDQESLAQLCESLQQQPATIIIFAEGTRFNPAKHRAQNSPYQHLLNPRSGGVSALLQGLGEQLDECLDFTLIYQNDKAGFWQFLTGDLRVQVELQQRSIPHHLIQVQENDAPDTSIKTKEWLNSIWLEKDKIILNSSDYPK